ncbi:MAG TPA: NAD(P)-dependent oxidoreductase, partial [bacterium]|nr:NAD(P)-dependent oxidoreductase [bacterium]
NRSKPPVVLRIGADTDNIDLGAAKELGVVVVRTHGNQNSVANLTLRFALAFLRLQHPAAFDSGTAADLSQDARFQTFIDIAPRQFLDASTESAGKGTKGRGTLIPQHEAVIFAPLAIGEKAADVLKTTKIALVGFGVIPQLITAKIRGVGEGLGQPLQPVMVWTREGGAARVKAETAPGIISASKAEILNQANIIFLHLPGQAGVYLGADEFQILAKREGPIAVINTARQAGVDHAALREALKAKSDLYYFADLDLIKKEVSIGELENLRRDFPNQVFLTPHIAASTQDAAAQVEKNTVAGLQELSSIFAGQKTFADADLDYVVSARSEARAQSKPQAQRKAFQFPIEIEYTLVEAANTLRRLNQIPKPKPKETEKSQISEKRETLKKDYEILEKRMLKGIEEEFRSNTVYMAGFLERIEKKIKEEKKIDIKELYEKVRGWLAPADIRIKEKQNSVLWITIPGIPELQLSSPDAPPNGVNKQAPNPEKELVAWLKQLEAKKKIELFTPVRENKGLIYFGTAEEDLNVYRPEDLRRFLAVSIRVLPPKRSEARAFEVEKTRDGFRGKIQIRGDQEAAVVMDLMLIKDNQATFYVIYPEVQVSSLTPAGLIRRPLSGVPAQSPQPLQTSIKNEAEARELLEQLLKEAQVKIDEDKFSEPAFLNEIKVRVAARGFADRIFSIVENDFKKVSSGVFGSVIKSLNQTLLHLGEGKVGEALSQVKNLTGPT